MITVSHDLLDFRINGDGHSISGPVVFDAIRAVHPYTPILIFGGMHCYTISSRVNWRIYAGHTHIRDCQQYDGRSMALESGRYMETIGTLAAFSEG